MDRCTSCHYYDRNQRGGEAKIANAGQCRRSAPALSPINQKSYMIEGVWPTVRDDDWCGEWKALQRRVDTARMSEVLNTPLSSPFSASSTSPPRTPLPAPRAAFGALSNEPARAASVSTLSPTSTPLTNAGGGSGRGND